MRVALVIAVLLSTGVEASAACMTKQEARRAHPTAHLYWHGPNRCWDANPIAKRRYRAERKVEVDDDETPLPTPRPVAALAMEMPVEQEPQESRLQPADLLRWANTMARDQVVDQTPWEDRWPEIAAAPVPAQASVVSTKYVIMTIAGVLMFIALMEVMFGGMIERRLNKRDGYLT